MREPWSGMGGKQGAIDGDNVGEKKPRSRRGWRRSCTRGKIDKMPSEDRAVELIC